MKEEQIRKLMELEDGNKDEDENESDDQKKQ